MATTTIEHSSLRQAVAGGIVVTLAMALSAVTVGLSGIGGDQAKELLGASLPVAETLFSTAMIVSSTTLALMLTMLGMTADEAVDHGFYTQIRRGATIAVAVFAVSVTALIVVAIPFRAGGTSDTVYAVLYYAISSVGALVGGALVAVMITMHGAIRNLIGLVDDEEEDAEIAVDG